MGASVRPDPAKARISRNVDKMSAQGASESEIEQYLQSEGLSPVARSPLGEDLHAIKPDTNVPLRKDLGDLRAQSESTRVAPRGVRKATPEGGVLNPIVQGATSGLSDEIEGAVAALAMGSSYTGDFAKNYQHNRDYARTQAKQYAQQHPKTNVLATLTGGALPLVATGGASLAPQGAGLLARMGVGAAEGVALGGLAGAGYSEGTSPRAVVGDAAKSGVLGGLVGGALPAVATGAGKLGRSILDVSGKRTGSAPVRATGKLLEALKRDNLTIGDIRARAAEAGGKPVSIVDLAGENTTGLARAAQAVPSSAKQAVKQGLMDRQAGAMGRVIDDLETATGLPRQDVYELADALVKSRKSAAEPLYETAFAQGQALDSPEIRRILATPAGKAAYREALVDAGNNFHELPTIHKMVQRASKVLGPDGQPQMVDDIEYTSAPDLRTVDYVKKVFDRLAKFGQPIAPRGTASTDAATAKRLSGMLASAADAQVPAYKTARDQFAGDIALQDALDAGLDFVKKDSRQSAKELAGMTAGEREMYKTGALDAIRSALDNVDERADVTRVLFSNARKKAQLRTLVGDEAYAKLVRSLTTERTMATTKNAVLGGPVTFRGQAELADLGADPVQDFAVDASKMGLKGAAVKRALAELNQRRRGIAGRVADELSGQLTAGAVPGGSLGDMLTRLEAGPGQTRTQDVSGALGPILRRLLSGQIGSGATR